MRMGYTYIPFFIFNFFSDPFYNPGLFVNHFASCQRSTSPIHLYFLHSFLYLLTEHIQILYFDVTINVLFYIY